MGLTLGNGTKRKKSRQNAYEVYLPTIKNYYNAYILIVKSLIHT